MSHTAVSKTRLRSSAEGQSLRFDVVFVFCNHCDMRTPRAKHRKKVTSDLALISSNLGRDAQNGTATAMHTSPVALASVGWELRYHDVSRPYFSDVRRRS